MNIYWAENTDPRGGRFILAKSMTAAKKLALERGMVKDIGNLTISKEPQERYQDTNINEVKSRGYVLEFLCSMVKKLGLLNKIQ